MITRRQRRYSSINGGGLGTIRAVLGIKSDFSITVRAKPEITRWIPQGVECCLDRLKRYWRNGYALPRRDSVVGEGFFMMDVLTERYESRVDTPICT